MYLLLELIHKHIDRELMLLKVRIKTHSSQLPLNKILKLNLSFLMTIQ